MNELFSMISRPGRFKWEADARNDDIAKIIDINGEDDQPLIPQGGMDPFAIDPPGDDTVSYILCAGWSYPAHPDRLTSRYVLPRLSLVVSVSVSHL